MSISIIERPGQIQVTQRFYECLQGQGKFQFERRGVINVKGKGDVMPRGRFSL
jgi:hypothetical protein